jgi:hypothetical protein
MTLVLGVNSYSSISDADDYFVDVLNADAWFNANVLYKSKALVSSSRELSLYIKDECKLPFTPPLSNLKLAIAAQELSLYVLAKYCASQGSSSSSTSSAQLKRAKAGSVEVEYFQLTSAEKQALEKTDDNKSIFPANVMKLLSSAGCLGSAASLGNVIVTGTHGKSDQCDDYGRTQGYY